MADPHGSQGYRQGCRCSVCREGQRDRVRAQRAERRGLTPVPAAPAEEPQVVVEPTTTQAQLVAEPGPCVAAVRADIARLGVRQSQPALCAAAEAMAAILDNRLWVTTQPSACRQLMNVMAAAQGG